MKTNTIRLYHGSKSGISGIIQPKSRPRCDFGKGFYMGTKPEQAKTLVYNKESPMFYTLDLHLENIPESRILRLSGMDWAFYVLYNRNKLEDVKNSDFYEKMQGMDRGKDIVIGPIADDNLNMSMQRFVDGYITDAAFLKCIQCIDYGIQYVAKTENACRQIEILSKEPIDPKKYEEYQTIITRNRKTSRQTIKDIESRYQAEGRHFKEILNDFKRISLSKLPDQNHSLQTTPKTNNDSHRKRLIAAGLPPDPEGTEAQADDPRRHAMDGMFSEKPKPDDQLDGPG